ncbi:MAG: ArsR/SmtB family transcription factor [Anaerolineae bacterium]
MNIYHVQAQLLKHMAHPIRLQILDQIRQADECVCHLAAVLNKPQPYVSQQLAVLRNAGLIRDHRDGTHVFYGLANEQAGVQVGTILAALLPDAPRERQRVTGCCCPKCMMSS